MAGRRRMVDIGKPQGSEGNVGKVEKKMSIVKQRLANLWRRQTIEPNPPRLWPNQYPDSRMVMTIREPMKISGTMLLPGRYACRPLNLGTQHSLVQIFNEDLTRLVVTLAPMSEN